MRLRRRDRNAGMVLQGLQLILASLAHCLLGHRCAPHAALPCSHAFAPSAYWLEFTRQTQAPEREDDAWRYRPGRKTMSRTGVGIDLRRLAPQADNCGARRLSPDLYRR